MNRFRPIVLFSLVVALLAGPLLSMAQAQEATPEAERSLAPIVWRTKTDGNLGLYDRPAEIAGDRIYIVDPDGTLTARNVRTGSVAWEIETGLVSTTGPLSVSANDDVVAVVRDEEMRVYDDNNNGAELWTRTATNPGDVFPPAVFVNNLLITNEMVADVEPHSIATLYGLEATTGNQVWEYVAAGGLQTYTIPVAGDLAVVSLSDGYVDAVSVVDGTLQWHSEAHTTGYIAPLIAGNVVIAQGETGSHVPTITAFNLLTGAVRWSANPSGFLEGIAGSSAIVTVPTVFDPAGSSTASIKAFDIQTGTDRGWTIDDASVTAIASAGDETFLATTSSDLAGVTTSQVLKLDATGGEIEWTLPVESPSFSLTPCGEKLYVRHGAFASTKTSDGTVVYDYAVGKSAPPAICNDGTLAATIGSDGVVAVHDTEITPNLDPRVPFNSRIRPPFFTTRPIRVPEVPEGDTLVLGVWRGQVSADGWVELPAEAVDLNLFVEEGSIYLLESSAEQGQDPLVVRVNAGEVVAVPEGGASIRAADGSFASLYAAGLLPQEVADRIGADQQNADILPAFETVGTIAMTSPPPDDVLQITVTTLDPAANTGTWPRLSSWPSMILVTSGSLDVPTAPGVQQPEEQRSIAAYQLLTDAGDSDEIAPDVIVSAVSQTDPATGLLVGVEPTTYSVLSGCYGRCFVR